MKRSVLPPHLHTWDFSSCPEEQVRACLYYEAARESAAVKKYRSSETFHNSPLTDGVLGTQYIAFFCPQFPDKPWLSIDVDARKERLRKAELADEARGQDGLVVPNYTLRKFKEEFARAQLDFEMSVSQEGPPPSKDTPPPTFGIRTMAERKATWIAVSLDWSKSKNTLKREFQKLLDKLPDSFASKPPGRCNHRDLLNGLGAKRLRDHCKQHHLPNPVQSALEMWQTHAPDHTRYNDASAMRRAIRKTEKSLEELYQLKAAMIDLFDGTESRPILSVLDI